MGHGAARADTKVPSPFTKADHAGIGTTRTGGSVADVGNMYPFGNTEEQYTLLVQGCDERGASTERPFDHATGKGWARARRGQYHDATKNKNNQVVELIVETLGGVASTAARLMKFTARRAKDK